MNQRTVTVVLLTVALLVGAVPTTAVAQGTEGAVFLNQDITKIATISLDGQAYEVYRYDNLIPYASGIDIYTDGNRVTSGATANRVLTALAERRAVDELGPDDIKWLKRTSRTVNASADDVSAATTEINETVSILEALKRVRANGTTAYNASVEAAPAVAEFNDSARERLPEFRSYVNDSNAYTQNATALIGLIQQRKNGTEMDPQRLYDRYAATLEARENLRDHLRFAGLPRDMTEMATLSGTVANNVSTVPERGEQLAQQFGAVENTSTVAANRTDALELTGFDFEDPEDVSETRESEWMDDWQSRRNAAMDVYQTIGGLAASIVVLFGYISWRRRRG